MAKSEAEPNPSRVKKTLGKRINIGPTKGKLGRDVKAPRWLRAIGGYIKGSYQELRLVRWPSRRATWGFTLAVILFTLAMSGLILGLDYGFDQLFKQVIL